MQVAYRDRPEWSDIEPIPQDDGPNPLVPIAYSSSYSDAMGYFRAVSRLNEKSPRVLELLADIIDMNPAHYTIWQYRQDVLFAINADLRKELDYLDDIAANQAKNYQVWHHRRVVVDRLGDGSRELPFINEVLDEDSKNYHAWSYRQWVVSRFNLWDHELEYTANMLIFDVRNNSAWNYRFFILFSRPQGANEQDIKSEIEFAKHKIIQVPKNASSWSYLKGVLDKAGLPLETLRPFLEELRAKDVESPQLSSTFIDMLEQSAKNQKRSLDPTALQMCDDLAGRLDVIRRAYWEYRKMQLQKLV